MDGRKVTGKRVDLFSETVRVATISWENGIIRSVEFHPDRDPEDPELPYLLPGFIDAHVHIESSMLVPSEFARLAVVHGTVGTISDPHEIANVLGLEGVEYMIDNGNRVPFYFHFGAPPCVPATTFETAGDELTATDIRRLLERPEIRYLSEVMNFPGVLNQDADMMEKMRHARELGKVIDGHAPGLRGEEARRYAQGGFAEGPVWISTDHECFTYEEAWDKIQAGMKIIIREGSAARNFDALIDLLRDFPDHIMFGTDDMHPDSLAKHHINALCARAVAKGLPLFHVLRAACLNPVLHYGLECGLLREGDAADLLLCHDLREFRIEETIIRGQTVAREGKTLLEPVSAEEPNHFTISHVQEKDFVYPLPLVESIPVIRALDGQLITLKEEVPVSRMSRERLNEPYLPEEVSETLQHIPHGMQTGMQEEDREVLIADPDQDILKLVVVNRYKQAPVARAWIRGFGLKEGALASSVAHDSHNIVAVGVDDHHLEKAINGIIRHKGGISCSKPNFHMVLPLPVAGLMSTDDGYRVAELYEIIDRAAREAGSTLRAPFMTLSFMALLVIPHRKLSDRGLFDGDNFTLHPDWAIFT